MAGEAGPPDAGRRGRRGLRSPARPPPPRCHPRALHRARSRGVGASRAGSRVGRCGPLRRPAAPCRPRLASEGCGGGVAGGGGGAGGERRRRRRRRPDSSALRRRGRAPTPYPSIAVPPPSPASRGAAAGPRAGRSPRPGRVGRGLGPGARRRLDPSTYADLLPREPGPVVAVRRHGRPRHDLGPPQVVGGRADQDDADAVGRHVSTHAGGGAAGVASRRVGLTGPCESARRRERGAYAGPATVGRRRAAEAAIFVGAPSKKVRVRGAGGEG